MSEKLKLPLIEKLPEILFPTIGKLALSPVVEPDSGITLFHEYPDLPEARRVMESGA